ncbi:CC_3452 family protein [Alterisphingorhabdus coralli]|uniref:Uncharacterized protein n=1 Tax=Alterisphingorhabdus coralli TaxID=3071408 RepID=A0AA97I1C4_9SPHN|nr:hypothetical protein [Parasphingorhabdus sp. SCSIO 66989]WOE75243.1 hypothetical protein RB602_00555 [Parasphingorhabdus sp. SCSIO 66989]
MSRILNSAATAAIAATAAVTLFASPAQAGSKVYYEAKLAAPVEKQTEIIRGVVWRCSGDTCRAPKTTSRPTNVCARLVRKMGEVTEFTTRGEAMAAEDIADCNGKD